MRVWKTEYGDKDEAMNGEILRSTVGSGVHGIAIEGTDDHDEMGVYIETPEHLLGVGSYREDYTARTKAEGERSEPGDVDLVVYSLGKYLRLAMKGNPTALLPLYAPEESILLNTVFGVELRENRDWFLSRDAVERFLGYMHAQHERMMGFGKRNRVPVRPELIEKYGWDTKYGSHALRLAYQGYEIALSGHLTLPLPDDVRDRVLAVKQGEVPQHRVSVEIRRLAGLVQSRVDDDVLAVEDRADVEAITDWAISARKRYWGWE